MTPERSIQHIDAHLTLLRESWMVCGAKARPKYERLIDSALDERLTHMKLRDA